MLRNFKILPVIAFLCLSCIPEQSEVQEGMECFDAVFENLSSSHQCEWKAGDRISINGYLYHTPEGGAEASFVPVSDPAPDASEYLAVYPADVDVYGKGIKGTLAGTIRLGDDDTLPDEYLVSVAKSSTTSLVFRNIYSFLSVDVDTDGVKRLTIASKQGETISGDYTVDYSDRNPLIFLSKGGDEISVERNDGAPFPKGARIRFAVLPQMLESGFMFSAGFDSETPEIWSREVSEKLVLSRGMVTDIGSFYYDHSTGSGGLEISGNMNVSLNIDDHMPSPVSELIFGSYSEMHGGDLIPGVCEQYIVNPSFEEWIAEGHRGESKNELVFTGKDAVAEDPSVAYPWEKRIVGSDATFSVSKEDKFNTAMSQMIEVGSGTYASLVQRLALPFYRTNSYKVRFYIKAFGDISCRVSFHGVDSQESKILSEDVYIPKVSGDGWVECSHEFSLTSSSTYFNNRYSQYNLWIEFSGSGKAYVDQVTLFPSDCIEGIYNPETVDYFKKYNVRAIRWPGGNYTSGYNWKNGIGPVDDRPSLWNRAWGGIDPNFLGIDEFMRFCELTGAEPVIGVGYNPGLLSEQDIVDWVEYCNGPATSTYGAKRVENGHPEPYAVKYWGIGNEVYGSYQLGHVSAAEYSSGLSSIADKIKSIDEDVVVMASGRGVHNHYRGDYAGWTETLAASSAYDILDCHMYVYGYDKSSTISLSGEEYYRTFAAANLNLRDFIAEMRTTVPGKKIAFLEWGVLPKLSGKNNPTPQRQTFANLLLSACQYHEMIRNSDIVEMAAMHNFSIYVSPQTLHSEPVNIRTVLFREMSQMAGGYNIHVDAGSFPVYSQTRNMLDVGVRENVPEIDMVAVLKDNMIYLSCVNRSPSEEYSLNPGLVGAAPSGMSGVNYTSPRPYERSLWTNPIQAVTRQIEFNDDNEVILPPLSYSIIKISLKNGS